LVDLAIGSGDAALELGFLLRKGGGLFRRNDFSIAVEAASNRLFDKIQFFQGSS
jgi:hypothetical protein